MTYFHFPLIQNIICTVSAALAMINAYMLNTKYMQAGLYTERLEEYGTGE
jgi:hypothetical protein